jgi:hypothetical protein
VCAGVQLALLWPFVLGGLAGIPLCGCCPLDMLWFKAVFGSLLVLWCPLMLLAPRLPRLRGGRLADGAVGMVGGVLGGIGGFTGTVPTPVVHLARLRARHPARGDPELQPVDVDGDPAHLYIGSGLVTTAPAPSFAVVALAMLLPTLFGTRLYLGISELAFRRIVLAADPVGWRCWWWRCRVVASRG